MFTNPSLLVFGRIIFKGTLTLSQSLNTNSWLLSKKSAHAEGRYAFEQLVKIKSTTIHLQNRLYNSAKSTRTIKNLIDNYRKYTVVILLNK